MLSLATDYLASSGNPGPYLRRIAEAGFSHIHWCHQWDTDFLYADSEVEQIVRWMREYGLALTDLHGSQGREKGWVAADEYARLAGVELVLNRVRMVARLGGDVVVMHLPSGPEATEDPEGSALHWERVHRTLDALEPPCRSYGVRIALENLNMPHFATIRRVLDRYDAGFVGVCYDSGHGNLGGDGLAALDGMKDRLISVHLHDNNGAGDQHKLPFMGTIDWTRLAGILAASSYDKWISMEVSMTNSGFEDEGAFLQRAVEVGNRLTRMVWGTGGASAGGAGA